jgi:hypothetical protein
MYTRRSFLAFAAAAQLVNPLARTMALRGRHGGRQAVVCLPGIQLQTRAGRDVHFHNDLATGRLTILDMRHATGAGTGTPPILLSARQASASRHEDDFYAYSLTRRAAIGNTADLRRYMDWYAAAAGGLVLPALAQDEVEVLRLRFGVYNAGR